MTQLLLTTPNGVAPRTEDGNWGVVMFRTSGSSAHRQWFDYRPAFYDPAVHAEWDKGTMFAALPPDVAEVMIEGGYARIMTTDEAREFNAYAVGPKPVIAEKPPEPEPEYPTVSEADIPQEPHPALPEEVEDQGADVLGEQPDAVEPEPERKPVTRRKRLLG